MEYFIGLFFLCSFFILFKKGFSLSLIGGLSVSSRGNGLFINGQILSVTINNVLKFGDDQIKGNNSNSNSISQKNGDYSLLIKGGHVAVTGDVSVHVNNKLVK